MKLSLVVLTFNRGETVREVMGHNLKNAGRKIDELIWVDNGSHDCVGEVMWKLEPDVTVINRENLGVAKGYNRGIVLATGTHIIITGCDRFMPDGWASTFQKYFESIPQTGLISCYSQPIEKVPERIRHNIELVNGLPIQKAMPMEAKCFPREIIRDAGHLREDFGLYGWEDVEWSHRVERVCAEKGLITYTIPDFISKHQGTEGVSPYDGVDNRDYHEFKRRESNDPHKAEMMNRCRMEGWKYYSPYV